MRNKSIEQLALLWTRRSSRRAIPDTMLTVGSQAAFQKIEEKKADSAGSSISFKSSPYLIKVKDATVYAKSALEALVLPLIFETDVWIETFCPTNGAPIAIYVTQDGPASCSPAACVLSVVIPDEINDGTGASSSHPPYSAGQLSRFFASQAAAMTWLVAFPNAAILPVNDAWRLALMIHDNTNQLME